VAACGLPRETAPYDLRHAKGTHGLEASGGNLNGVAYLLGHKQVTTTNRYVHASQRAVSTVLDAFGRRERRGKRGGRIVGGGGFW
jgi:site-specific recombinase XerC